MTRAVSILLAIVLCLSGVAPALAYERTELAYDELEPVLVDAEEAGALAAQIYALKDDYDNLEQVSGLLSKLVSLYDMADTWGKYALIEYYRDVSEESNARYRQYTGIATELDLLLTQCVMGLFDSPCSAAAEAYAAERFSENRLEILRSGNLSRVGAVWEIISRYTDPYYEIANADYSGYDEPAYARALAVGELYLDYVAELKSVVDGSGYSVGDLSYLYRGTEYSQEELAALRSAVREIDVLPLYRALLLRYRLDKWEPVAGDAVLESVRAVAEEQFPFLIEPIDHMKANGYCQINGSPENRYAATFYLSYLDQPYLYAPSDGNDINQYNALIHELGHYNNYYRYGEVFPTSTTESEEVHSQALELLYASYYKDLLGDDYREGVELYTLYTLFDSVLYGCLIDEFEWRVFENTPETAEELCAMYVDLNVEYGMGSLMDSSSKRNQWATVSHLFVNPFYYLNYCTSALAAFEIWTISQDDPDWAVDIYERFAEESNKKNVSLPDALEAVGLPGVAESVYTVAAALWEYIDAFADAAAELNGIAITTPAEKLVYTVGEPLDISGLVVTGTYSDDTTRLETITAADVTGFDSSSAGTRTLTITVGGKTATYTVVIQETAPAVSSGGGGGAVVRSPSVRTGDASLITSDSAVLKGDIISNNGYGITECGFLWGTDAKSLANRLKATDNLSGGFSVTLGGLEADTTYYFQAYAKNAHGTATGAVLSFKTGSLQETTPAAPPATVFSDVPEQHWAYQDIIFLAEQGFVSGYPDGTFRPDAQITRAEFITVLVNALQLTAGGQGQTFSDTAGHWAENNVAAASSLGIVNGYPDNVFDPDAPINREQMAVMISNAANFNPVTGEISFADSAQISSWALEGVLYAANENIIRGYPDNTFRPQGFATRAEAISMIIRVKTSKSPQG